MAKACGLGTENGVASVAATTVRCAAKGHRSQKTEPSDTSSRKELSLSRPAAPVPKAKQNFIVLEALNVNGVSHHQRIISRAAFQPAAPMTPPPGWAAEPHRYRPLIGVR